MPVPKPLDLPFDPIARAADIWERRFGDSRAMAAVTSIMRVQQILLAELDALLRPHGLTFARYEALVLLRFSREGALPLRLIGQRLMVHPTSVTNIINRLEAQGLVARRPNPADGRGTLAEITEAGREVVARATADLMAADFGLGGYDGGPAGGDVRHAARAAGERGGLQGPLTQGVLTACGRQVLPPSVVMNTSCSPGSAGSATPSAGLVIPT